MPAEATQLYIKYGLRANKLDQQTETKVVESGKNIFFDILNLVPDKEYTYQVFCKRPNEKRFNGRDPHTFRTLREKTDTFSFAYVTDTHAYALWSQEESGTGQFNSDFEEFELTRDNLIADDSLDFAVLGGDWSMPNCSGCPGAFIDGQAVSSGSALTQLEANLRYQKTLDQDVLGPLFQELPFVYVIGDHEGEGLWQTNTNVYALEARLKYLPNPFTTYRGDPSGRYYSFETGPVQIIVIDVMGHTAPQPLTPEGWTLGEEQLTWLEETLATSDKKWKLIFAEHLVGGEMGPTSSFWKGRGSIKATDDDTPAGIYKGEQAQVDALMQQYGAQIFFSGNDHIASIGEKLNPDGSFATLHVIGGNTGIGGNWIAAQAYEDEMTFPGYTIPSYKTNTIGTRQPGYFRITVNGEDNLLLEYIRTNLISSITNATPLFSYTLDAHK